MSKASTVAVIVGRPGEYSAIFPDYPGAGASGDTIDEATRRAEENFLVHVEGRVEADLDFPKSRTIDEIKADKEFLAEIGGAKAIEAWTIVHFETPGKSVRVNVSLDDGLLASIDQAATRQGESRSAFLARAARQRIASLREAS